MSQPAARDQRRRLEPLPKKKQAEWKDEQLPYDGEAEAEVIGCLLAAPRAEAVKLLPYLLPDLFYDPINRIVFEAIAAVATRGETPNVTNVAHELVTQQVLDTIGGGSKLRELARGWNGGPINPLETARYLDNYRLQRLVIELKLAPLGATGHESVATMLQQLRDGERALRPLAKTAAQVMEGVYERMRDGDEDAQLVRTGINALDRKIGLTMRGCITLIKGRSGLGKSAFAFAVLRGIARQGTRGLLHSLEMFDDECGRRALADRLEADNYRVQRNMLDVGERERLEDAATAEAGERWMIRDEDGPWPLQLAAYESLCLEWPDLGVIVVDYVQLLRQQERRGWRSTEETRAAFLDGVGRDCKLLARRQNIAIVLLAQMNDEGLIRECRGLQHAADVVVEIEIKELRGKGGKVKPNATYEKDAPCVLEVEVQKARNARPGLVEVQYTPRYQRVQDFPAFAEPEPGEEEGVFS